MSRKVANVVVTCTARKTKIVPDSLAMVTVRRDKFVERFAEWSARLDQSDAVSIPAIELYSGNAWSVVRDIHKGNDLKCDIRLWVLSAGHGLVRAQEKLQPYSATFAFRHDDSVIPARLRNHSTKEWWKLLIKRRRRKGHKVASLLDLAVTHPHEPLIVTLSPEYLAAVEDDLLAARCALAKADDLSIISAGATKNGILQPNFIPCDARLELCFGRPRIALNAKILQRALQTFAVDDLCASRLKSHFGNLLDKLPAASYPVRLASNDDTILAFIRGQLANNIKESYTSLLRQYRSSGRACEQKRFRGLFRAVAAELSKGTLS